MPKPQQLPLLRVERRGKFIPKDHPCRVALHQLIEDIRKELQQQKEK